MKLTQNTSHMRAKITAITYNTHISPSPFFYKHNTYKNNRNFPPITTHHIETTHKHLITNKYLTCEKFKPDLHYNPITHTTCAISTTPTPNTWPMCSSLPSHELLGYSASLVWIFHMADVFKFTYKHLTHQVNLHYFNNHTYHI